VVVRNLVNVLRDHSIIGQIMVWMVVKEGKCWKSVVVYNLVNVLRDYSIVRLGRDETVVEGGGFCDLDNNLAVFYKITVLQLQQFYCPGT